MKISQHHFGMLQATIRPRDIQLRFPFDEALNQKVKDTKSGGWDEVGNCWNLFPSINSIEFLLKQKVKLTDQDVTYLDQMLDRIEKRDAGASRRRELSRALEAPAIPELAKFVQKPWSVFPCQWVPVHYALEQQKVRILIADEMGVGKTIESVLITMLDQYKHMPVLITGPANVVGNWQDELLKLFGVPSVIIDKNFKGLTPGIRFYICSQDRLKNYITLQGRRRVVSPIFAKTEWFLLADEVQYLKNRKTLRYKSLKAFCKHINHRILMTGTPIQNRPVELYSPLSLLDDHFMSWATFVSRYCEQKWTPFGMTYCGSINQKELNQMLDNHYMIRRMKVDVHKQLPEKMRQRVVIGTHKIPKAKNVLGMFSVNSNFKATNADFLEWVEEIMDSAEKILVFGHFSVMLDAIQTICKKRKWQHVRIDGSVPAGETRQSLVRKFQTDPNVKVGILSLTAAGSGITMTAANVSIFCDLYWEPMTHAQAEDRTHRPGQVNPCLSLYPLSTGFDQFMFKLLLGKQGTIKRIIDGGIEDSVENKSLLKEIAREYDVSIN